MKILQLAIGEGDVQEIPFKSPVDLIEYIQELKRFECIWLVTDDDGEEIIITESIDTVHLAIDCDLWNLNLKKNTNLFFQEYQSFESAYAVSLTMREGNPKCYD